ncbi:MAG: hypothetical protein ACI8Z1_002798 [Candidatus Azotimanducaceae bacterium]|jgi:hypothetical protein
MVHRSEDVMGTRNQTLTSLATHTNVFGKS